MKRVFKKNQIMVTVLALMVAVAGYMAYSGSLFTETDEAGKEVTNQMPEQALLDLSLEDISSTDDAALESEASGDIESLDSEASSETKEGVPGDSVLTSSQATETIAAAKVSREQVRAANKETLETLINNDELSAEQKEVAVNQMIAMTKIAEQEVTIETLLNAKGFPDAAVTLTEDSVDIVVVRESLTDAHRAQIEDIISRKTTIKPENIVITPVQTAK